MEGCLLDDAYGDSSPAKKAGRTARREERDRAKKCKIPVLDPDRQSFIKKPISEPFVSGSITPGSYPQKGQKDKPSVMSANALPVPSAAKPAFFGADPLEEGFAPYSIPYTMQIDFKDSFNTVGTAGAQGKPLGNPAVNDMFEPLIMKRGNSDSGEPNLYSEFGKKLDSIFARLDDLESGRNGTENAQTEIMLFVMTGIFILFTLDLLSKR